ncbi:glycosyl hydrolase family 61-domain-containing protein [Podospora didyma]|uniref:lytic cellulose monooxygenase (C4-dehydrogenating) n=1 Tax=Podospora didyma TaxID=330526 RepID=A0AAE0NU60_9PEZI|nr:glycosyl hydrolase family 61-domain-containing protein [Podospora didyma]
MAPLTLFTLAIFGVVFAATEVCAHGIATALVVFPTGTFYQGYNPSYQWSRPPPVVVGWSTPDDLQNTFVSPTSYDKPDIVCHFGATPAGAAAPVNAGDTIEIQWTPWPASHKGPVIDYLANCNGPCQNVDKTKLKFFKISEVGLADAASGTWGASQLTNNNNSWSVRIPKDIAPGNYVLRHEIIALHAAGQSNGAQNYPFCYSLAISSNGTANPAGVPATQFYAANNPGIKFDLFSKFTSYQIPGPALYSGALLVVQTKPGPIKATATGIAGFVSNAKVGAAMSPTSPAEAAAAAPYPAITAAAKYAARTLVKTPKRSDAPQI